MARARVAGRHRRVRAAAPLPEAARAAAAELGETFGYAHAVEWRWARGGWADRGPATVWTRMRIPVVEGEEPTPRQRVMVVADSGNGASNVLDWGRYLFINTELTVHFLREPVGEWVLLDARDADRRGRRGAGDVGAQRPVGTGCARGAGAVRRATMTGASRGRHERDARGGCGALARARPASSVSTASATARSTAFISKIAKLAPRQRRTPPPNGIHV